jgi:hypothetical protein
VSSIFDGSGKPIEPNLARNLYETVWDILDEACRYSTENMEAISSSARMLDYFRAKVATDKYDRETQRKLLQIVDMWGTFMGSECTNQSLKFFWLDQGIDGGEFVI